MPNTKSKNIIRVFEHQKLLFGNESGFEEKHWKALSFYNEKYQNKYFRLLHNGIRFSNYVGAIQAGDLTIEILPKIDKKNLHAETEKKKWHDILLEMLMECKLIKIDNVEKANLKFKTNSILDIYVEIFLNQVENLLHKGLIKKYLNQTENITALKGRIHFPKHISTNLIHREKFFINHAIYTKQNLYNQILNEGLQIIPTIITNTSLLKKLGRIILDYPELKRLKVTEHTFHDIQYDRKNIHYKEVIEIAKMLLLNYRPDISGGTNNVIAILFDMNVLWEEYIFRQLQKSAIDNLNVRRQQSQKFWKRNNSIYPKNIRPDIIIISGDDTIIVDTKWKLVADFTPDDDDLKQMFVYNLYWKSNCGILLYPGINDDKEPGTYFNFKQQSSQDNTCSVFTFNILNKEDLLDRNIGRRVLTELMNFCTI